MGYTVKGHILHKDGKPVAQKRTPNIGGTMTPDMLIMHYTAAQNAAGSIAWLCNPRSGASAHLVIDQAGNATQLAPFNRVCWHAGESRWKKRSGCNKFSIGIEMANPGPLKKLATGKFIDTNGQSVPASQVTLLRHRLEPQHERPWMIYQPAQREAAVAVAQALCSAYKIGDICGHDEIAPDRKRDPGPAFDLDNFVSRVRGRQ